MQILDGKSTAKHLRDEIAVEVARLKDNAKEVSLAVILVGDDPASATYVGAKEKACQAAGIRSVVHRLSQNVSQNELLALINVLNLDAGIDGILVQLPLPKHINEDIITQSIAPEKDVDGFGAISVGRLWSGLGGFVPCTPLGVMYLLERYNIDPTGLNAVVLGRSNIVGKPMAALLLAANATVTIAHSRTKNLKQICQNADIIVVAIGKANFLSSDMVKEGAIVIDVGINRLENGKLTGDVAYEDVAKKASFITPVPGGVGPMTIAMLLNNTLAAAKARGDK